MKMSKKIGIAVLAAGMVLAGCSNSAGGGSNPPVTYIGSKAPNAAKAVGDIVFTDGSATPYDKDAGTGQLTDEQKAAAIAVIFYVGTGLNSGSDTTTTRTLGVGLKHDKWGLVWCTADANAYYKHISTIRSANGSDNLERIGEFLTANNLTDDTGTATKYPAFYFAINYKDTAANVAGTNYESGWYLPSIDELFEIRKARGTVNAASKLCGGVSYEGDYWSSTDSDTSQENALYLYDPGNGKRVGDDKKDKHSVCAVREF